MALGPAFEDVLTAAQAGAGWACTRLYEELAGPVTGYLRLRGAAEPDDVASETFLAVFRSLASFEGDESHFRSWVFTIAHRRLLDEQRRRSRRPATTELTHDVEITSGETVEGDALTLVGSERLRGILQQLGDAQRQVVLLRIVGGLTIEETATVLGRRPGAVKQLQRRGLLKLQELLAPEGVTT